MTDAESLTFRSYDIVDRIRGILAGESPDVQGAAIAQIFAIYIAGHAPPLRENARNMLIECADNLTPVEINEMIDAGMVPPNWKEDDDMPKMTTQEVDAACDRLDRLLVDGMALIRKGDADGALLILQEALKTANQMPKRKSTHAKK